MKKNFFIRAILFILECIEFVILSVILGVVLIVIQPFIWCFTKGKKNVNKNDEARVFVSNHYEIYGPVVVFLRFPFKFRPWVIDKMCNPETIEQQASIGFYNNYRQTECRQVLPYEPHNSAEGGNSFGQAPNHTHQDMRNLHQGRRPACFY